MIKIETIGQLLDYVETEEKAYELIDYIDSTNKEIDRLNDVINELIDKKEKLLKYKRFIFNIVITPLNWDRPYHYQLHNYTKQNLYEQLYNLRKEILDELRGDSNELD